jgi:pimeloyl-ACP methyl ester carboxylesterase
VRVREEWVPVADRRLAATVFEPEEAGDARPAIMFLHGRGSDQQGYASRATAVGKQLGAVGLTVDLSGHGRSAPPGSFGVGQHLADGLAAYQVLAMHPQVDDERIGICGASYGAYLGALMAARRPVRRLLLRAPALYGDAALARDERPPEPGAEVAAAQLFAGLRGSGSDVLILESERDEVVPPAVIEAYLRGYPRAQHAVLGDATHALSRPEWNEAFIEVILDWFRPL